MATNLSIPGKIFVLGEYAVLEEAPAWVAAVNPRFEFKTGSGKSTPFSPESPVGRFLAKNAAAREIFVGEYVDPWKGDGGFGGSTAEFAFAAHLAGMRDPLAALTEYRALHADRETPPSGADLVAQWAGGVIEWNPKTRSYRDLSARFESLPILVFSASHLPSRKTKTHAHLDALPSGRKFDSLRPAMALAEQAIGLADGNPRVDLPMLGTAFTRFAEALHDLGYESEAAHADRLALSEHPHVLGAKGCGAMQSDAMLVLLDSFRDEAVVNEIVLFAEERGLRLLSRGLPHVPGIAAEGFERFTPMGTSGGGR